MWQVLAGKTSEDNDRLSLEEGRASEPWLHAAGVPGSHVVVRRVEEGASKAPSDVMRKAAGIAAFYSKAKGSGSVPVHVTTCGRVGKPAGAPAGKVQLRGSVEVLKVAPLDPARLARGSGGKAEKEAEAAVPTAKPLSLKKQLEQQDRQRDLRRRKVKRLEESIRRVEEELEQLDEDLKAKGSDFQAVTDLLEQQGALQAKQEELYAQWDALTS